MIAEQYDSHEGTFWVTIPGMKPMRCGQGQFVVHLSDAIQASIKGWRIIDARMSPGGVFIALVRKGFD
jgi:hypothetical protein